MSVARKFKVYCKAKRSWRMVQELGRWLLLTIIDLGYRNTLGSITNVIGNTSLWVDGSHAIVAIDYPILSYPGRAIVVLVVTL